MPAANSTTRIARLTVSAPASLGAWRAAAVGARDSAVVIAS
jgi:hypothetical protein